MKVLQKPLLALLLAQPALCDFAEQCAGAASALASQLSNTTIVHSSDFIAQGANLSIAQLHPTCESFNGPVAYDLCRVRFTSITGPESSVDLEAWLPGNWTGRFLEIGNGGMGGCISYSDLNYGASRGFAAVCTNNGHTGNTGLPFYGKPGVVEDFAYRAIHTGAVLGKQLVKAFYGDAHTKAYYLGCSTGGRQGFREAQDFPDDFDGIVTGAPAIAFNSLTVWSGRFASITGPPGSPTFLPAALWNVVLLDLLDQCDHLDGHVDGVIEDPDLCEYKPEHLICGEGQNSSSTCLTGPQASTVRGVFSPFYDQNGELAYPRLQPGANATASLFGGSIFSYTTDWLRYVIYNDPSWNGTAGVQELADARRVNPYGIETFNPDLSRVRERGSKILHYHGLQDQIISSDNSARYYNLVSRSMQLAPAELDEFYRYFRISGMAHCQGGTGALNIGNRAINVAGFEPERNVLSAIVEWVEGGKAPEHVLGTAFNDPAKTSVKFERKHCKYPARNVYSGAGDPNSADSWNCVL